MIAGGIAVFAKHWHWMIADETRVDVCRVALRELLADPPEDGAFANSENETKWTWTCFLQKHSVTCGHIKRQIPSYASASHARLRYPVRCD